MTETEVTAITCGRYTYSNADWPTNRDKDNGLWAANALYVIARLSGTYNIMRSGYLFNLSGIDSGDVVSGVTVEPYVDFLTETAQAGEGMAVVWDSDQVHPKLFTNDYSFDRTEYDYASPLATIDEPLTKDQYNVMTFNATGIAAVQANIGGNFRFMMVHLLDLNNITPTGNSMYGFHNPSEANPLKLIITHAPPLDPDALDINEGDMFIQKVNTGNLTIRKVDSRAMNITKISDKEMTV